LTLLDAYALIAFLVGGPARAEVRGILREGGVAVASANLAETLDVSQRVHGLSIARAMEVLEPLLEDTLAVIALDATTARAAAELRASYYHRSDRPISLADAVLLASAKPDWRIATADPDVLAVASSEQLGTIALPAQGA
jgi:PIN domain nuclease of toxin-antitoxin system